MYIQIRLKKGQPQSSTNFSRLKTRKHSVIFSYGLLPNGMLRKASMTSRKATSTDKRATPLNSPPLTEGTFRYPCGKTKKKNDRKNKTRHKKWCQNIYEHWIWMIISPRISNLRWGKFKRINSRLRVCRKEVFISSCAESNGSFCVFLNLILDSKVIGIWRATANTKNKAIQFVCFQYLDFLSKHQHYRHFFTKNILDPRFCILNPVPSL